MLSKELLRNLLEDNTYETEYDGRMYDRCKYCDVAISENEKHDDDCLLRVIKEELYRSDGNKTVETAGPVELNRLPQFKTVAVQYQRSLNFYTFMTDQECKIGDKAVVFTQGNWNVVTIREIHDIPQLNDDHNYTWLVQIVDRSHYDELIQRDHEGHPQAGSRL